MLWARGRGESDGRVNWGQVGAFLAVTFGLTVLLNLAVWLTGGLVCPAATRIIGLQMLVPAFSAILLHKFVSRDSPIDIRSCRAKPRWVFSLFLAFIVASAVATELLIARPNLSTAANAMTPGLSLLGLPVF